MTAFTYLLLGLSTILAGQITSLSSWLVGSAIFQGNVFFDTTNNTNPGLYIGTGAGLTIPKTIPLTLSGTRVVAASWAVPSTYASGAVINNVSVECNNVPRGTSGVLVIQNAASVLDKYTGTVLRKGVQIGSGALTQMNSGAVINTKIGHSQFLNFIGTHSGAITSAFPSSCVMKIFAHEKFGR